MSLSRACGKRLRLRAHTPTRAPAQTAGESWSDFQDEDHVNTWRCLHLLGRQTETTLSMTLLCVDCWLSIWSQGPRCRSCDLCSWQRCLSSWRTPGRRGVGGERQREVARERRRAAGRERGSGARGMIKGGSRAPGDSPTTERLLEVWAREWLRWSQVTHSDQSTHGTVIFLLYQD